MSCASNGSRSAGTGPWWGFTGRHILGRQRGGAREREPQTEDIHGAVSDGARELVTVGVEHA